MNNIERKVFKLKTITPIHINDGQGSQNRDQHLMEINKREYLVSMKKLFNFISLTNDFDKLERFVNELVLQIGNNRIPQLEELVLKNKICLNINVPRFMQKGIIVSENKEFFIKNALGKPYIPGTSIKGAMRTAVLWKLVEENKFNLTSYLKDETDRYQKEMNEYFSKKNKRISAKKPKRQQQEDKINQLLQNYNITGEKISGSYNDLFRVVKISDSLLHSNITEIKDRSEGYVYYIDSKTQEGVILDKEGRFLYYKEYSFNIGDTVSYMIDKDSDGLIAEDIKKSSNKIVTMLQDNKIALFSHRSNKGILRSISNKKYECFSGNAEIVITLDMGLLNEMKNVKPIPFNNINELIRICEEFSQALWEEEINFINYVYGSYSNERYKIKDLDKIKKFYGNDKCPATLRIGWGTGMLGTSVAQKLDYNDRKKLRNTFMKNLGNKVAPKSRRFIWHNNIPILPLGWISLEEV